MVAVARLVTYRVIVFLDSTQSADALLTNINNGLLATVSEKFVDYARWQISTLLLNVFLTIGIMLLQVTWKIIFN